MNTASTPDTALEDRPAPDPSDPPPLGGRGTGVGSLPHTDVTEASRIVLGELPDFPFLPELPGRGPHAGIIGRGVALLPGIDAELATTGWRIGGGAGLEQSRAVETLAGDLDAFEAVGAAGARPDTTATPVRPAVVKTQVVGPLTLASALELPGGRSVVADPGALRDVAQSLADGVREHRAELSRRLGIPVVVQLDEPGLPAVLTGAVRRPSGLGRYPALSTEQASGLLGEVLRAARPGGGDRQDKEPGGVRPVRTVVHCCADAVPVELLLDAGADAIGFDPSRVAASSVDQYALAVESGAVLFVGAVRPIRPSSDNEDTPAGNANAATRRRSVAGRVLDWWHRLGFGEELAAERIVVTTACGSAGADRSWAVRALGLARDTARQLAS